MNAVLDYREAFFKERVITLMSRPTVMKTINNNKSVMGKKSTPVVVNAQKESTPTK